MYGTSWEDGLQFSLEPVGLPGDCPAAESCQDLELKGVPETPWSCTNMRDCSTLRDLIASPDPIFRATARFTAVLQVPASRSCGSRPSIVVHDLHFVYIELSRMLALGNRIF